VVAAADDLRYRDFMTVALVVPEDAGFPDNWIYIHDPSVRVGRVQNFGVWSPYLVKEGRTCLGLEFFVNEGDDMWTKPDDELIEQGKRELQQLGLVDAARVGRNGMHKYNNQDHSMYTAMLSVENIFGAHHDVWAVNVEEEYHEEEDPTTERGTGRDAPLMPRPADRPVPPRA